MSTELQVVKTNSNSGKQVKFSREFES